MTGWTLPYWTEFLGIRQKLYLTCMDIVDAAGS